MGLRGLVLVSFLAQSKPNVPLNDLFLLRNQTETLATQANDSSKISAFVPQEHQSRMRSDERDKVGTSLNLREKNGAASLRYRNLAEITVLHFLCVNRSPIRYGLRAGAKASIALQREFFMIN